MLGGGKWGTGGREVGEKGEGSGGKGGGKWGMPTPLSTPSIILKESTYGVMEHLSLLLSLSLSLSLSLCMFDVCARAR